MAKLTGSDVRRSTGGAATGGSGTSGGSGGKTDSGTSGGSSGVKGGAGTLISIASSKIGCRGKAELYYLIRMEERGEIYKDHQL